MPATANFDTAPDPVIVVARDGSAILAANDEALRLFGYEREELLGKAFDLLVPDTRARRKDGASFSAEMRRTALEIEGTPAIVITLLDTTSLEWSDRRHELLLEGSHLPTWIIDRQTRRFVLVNDAALHRYGYTRSEFLATPLDAIQVADGAGSLTRFVPAQPETALTASGSWHHRRKDGSVFSVQLGATPITFAGRPAVLTRVHDPDLDAALDALKVHERQLADAQALAHVGSWEWDIPADHVTWSAELYRMHGVSPETPAHFGLFVSLLHPDDSDRVKGIVGDALEKRHPLIEYECRIVKPDGEVRQMRHRSVVMVDAAGQPVRMSGTAFDITEHRQTEQALADSERHHRELIENSSDLVMAVDGEGLCLYASPSAHPLLGRDPTELLGAGWIELLHPADVAPAMQALRGAFADPGTPKTHEVRLLHRNGTWRTLEARGQARQERSGEYRLLVNSRDVTDRKLAEEQQQSMMRELRAANEVAETATRAKSEFLANMSHEIRTPMNAVLGLTELLLDTELTAEQRRHLEMVHGSGDVLLALLNDILDLSKIEAEGIEIESIPLDLAGLVHSTASLVAHSARARGLELLVDVGSDVPRWVRGDPTRLRQILTNLLSNAVKFTHDGEIVVAAKAGGVEGGQAMIHFAVRDTGIGIPRDKLESIFQEFSQVDASTTRQYGGTGLGLAIARRLVMLIGGSLTVASEVGRGSEFRFTLSMPLEDAPASHADTTPIPLAGARVLVVDDNGTNRRIVREILAPLGASITEAPGADAALAALERASAEGRPYAVALLDSQMPGHDGWSLAADVRRHPTLPRTHLIMLTSADERGDAEQCRKLGIDGYLVKPVSRSELIEAIASVFAGTAVPGVVVTRHALAEARVRLRILLAEDNPVNQEVALAMLRKRGHDVTVVDNGVKAIAAVSKGTFDIVLMDIHMPEMDGLAATAGIRKLPGCANLPIVAVTADVLADERDECLAAGMSGYLSKPFKSHELFAIVEGWNTGMSIPLGTEAAIGQAPPADIEGFRATMRQAGVEDAVDGILDLLVEDAPKRSEALATAIASGGAGDIQLAAHAFKSAAGTIGAAALAATLGAIELAGMEGRVGDARMLAASAQRESEAVVAYVRRLREEAPARV